MYGKQLLYLRTVTLFVNKFQSLKLYVIRHERKHVIMKHLNLVFLCELLTDTYFSPPRLVLDADYGRVRTSHAYRCRNSLLIMSLVHLWLIRIPIMEKLEWFLAREMSRRDEGKGTGNLRDLRMEWHVEWSVSWEQRTRLWTILVTIG